MIRPGIVRAMATLMSATGQGTAAEDGGGRRPRRRACRATLLVAVSCWCCSLGRGFLSGSSRQLPAVEARAHPQRRRHRGADRRGAPDQRRPRASGSGHGQRLLISGVNPGTRSNEIARLVPEHQRWFSCCVDLDHSATNTIGNAIETRRWVEERGFKSLIVVTANYPHAARHGRAGARASRRGAGALCGGVGAGPRRELVGRIRSTARLLFLEYLKYIVASVRMVPRSRTRLIRRIAFQTRSGCHRDHRPVHPLQHRCSI